MVANIQKQAGHLDLISFKVKKYDESKELDIKALVHTFNITESMSLGSVRGSAVVYDSANFINNLPILGEEYLTITYSDYFGNLRTENMFIYAIDNVKPADMKKPDVLTYILHFTSVQKFFSDDFRVQKAYKPNSTNNGLISDYVKDLYKQYYETPLKQKSIKSKSIVVQTTSGQESYVIPRFTPEEAMMFFSRKAYLNSSPTQSFRFFENRDSFFFVTNEYMYQRSQGGAGDINQSLIAQAKVKTDTYPIFTIGYAGDFTANRQESLMYELLDVDFTELVNSITDISKGAYRRNTFEIDLLNGTIKSNIYDFISSFKDPNLTPTHDKAFIDERMKKVREMFVVKDYASTGTQKGYGVRDNTFYPEIFNKKGANFYHYDKNSITARIYGRNNLFAGNIITLHLNEFKSADGVLNEDVQRSGNYLVESINNVFYENTYFQDLTLSRIGLGK